MIGIGDASYKYDEKSVCGFLLFLVNKEMTRMFPMYWKAKQIEKVTHLSKDAETMNVSKMVDDSVYMVRQLELLLYGEYRRRIPVKLFMDS